MRSISIWKTALVVVAVLAMTGGALSAPAAQSKDKYEYSSVFWMYSDCNGEVVQGTYTATVRLHTVVTDGDTSHYTYKFRVEGEGVGMDSGMAYSLKLVENYSYNSTGGAGLNRTDVYQVWLRCENGCQDRVKVLIHMTVNANGELVVSFMK